MTPIQYLNSRIAKNYETGCMEWIGPKNRLGYGVFNSVELGRTSSHRAAWRLFRGDIPAGKFVLHSCNNRCCVNIDHLRLGTHSDNMRDRKNSGNYPVGSRHPNAKLSEEKVLEIYRATDPETEIAKKFGVHRGNINKIRNGKAWAHVTAVY